MDVDKDYSILDIRGNPPVEEESSVDPALDEEYSILDIRGNPPVEEESSVDPAMDRESSLDPPIAEEDPSELVNPNGDMSDPLQDEVVLERERSIIALEDDSENTAEQEREGIILGERQSALFGNFLQVVGSQISEFVSALFGEDRNQAENSDNLDNFDATNNFGLMHFLKSPEFRDFLTETEGNYCDTVMNCQQYSPPPPPRVDTGYEPDQTSRSQPGKVGSRVDKIPPVQAQSKAEDQSEQNDYEIVVGSQEEDITDITSHQDTEVNQTIDIEQQKALDLDWVVDEEPLESGPPFADEEPLEKDPQLVNEEPLESDPQVVNEEPLESDPQVVNEEPLESDPEVVNEEPLESGPQSQEIGFPNSINDEEQNAQTNVDESPVTMESSGSSEISNQPSDKMDHSSSKLTTDCSNANSTGGFLNTMLGGMESRITSGEPLKLAIKQNTFKFKMESRKWDLKCLSEAEGWL